MFDVEDVLTVVDTVVEKRGEGYTYPDWARLSESLEADDEDDLLLVPDGCHYMWTTEDRMAGERLGLDLIVGQPACLAGAVFAELGIMERAVAFNLENEDSIVALDGLDTLFTSEAISTLLIGQDHQDKGETWGQARLAMRDRAAQRK